MPLKQFFFPAFVVAICLMSCKKDADNCVQFREAPITYRRGYYTGAAYQDIPIALGYTWPDLCGSRGYLEVEKEGDVTTIRAMATVHECGGCFAKPAYMSDTFYFRAPRAGTYYLKLVGYEKELVDTVLVF